MGIISTCSSFCLCLLKGFCVDLKTFFAFLISFCHDFYDFFLLLFSKGQQTNRGRKVFADKYQEKRKTWENKKNPRLPVHYIYLLMRLGNNNVEECGDGRPEGKNIFTVNQDGKFFSSIFPISQLFSRLTNRGIGRMKKKSNYLRSPPFLKFSFLLKGKMFSTSSRFH